MHSICSGALLPVSGRFSADARFALVDSCTVDCAVLETAAILHSETKGLPNFPVSSRAASFKCEDTVNLLHRLNCVLTSL